MVTAVTPARRDATDYVILSEGCSDSRKGVADLMFREYKNTLRIERGRLGPLMKTPEEGIEIRPLTLFIGRQGTGKSLVSQLAYCLARRGQTSSSL